MVTDTDWSGLPEDIWSLVLPKLRLEDLIRCRSVCSSWLSWVDDLKQYNSESPWLMLPPVNISEHWRFMDLASQKTHEIHLPEVREGIIFGSSNDWLLLVVVDEEEDGDEDESLVFFNPFSRTQYQLPPSKHHLPTTYVSTTIDGNPVVLLQGSGNDMSFAKAGDKAWTDVSFPDPLRDFCGGTFCEGLFYMLDHHGRVVSLDLGFRGGSTNFCSLPVQVPESLPQPSTLPDWNTLMEKLVVLPGTNELLLIVLGNSDSSDEINNVKAFRLDQKEPMEMRNLGGYALFLMDGSTGSSYRVVGLTHAKGLIKGNCVYIANNSFPRSLTVFDMELQCITKKDDLDGSLTVFDMELQCITKKDDLDGWTIDPLIWITPSNCS